MDAESLVQIERVVSTAVGGAEGRLRKEIEALGTSLRQDFDEKTEALGTSLRQESNEKLTEKFEEAERHSGVLYEEVLRRIDLVIEGHQGLYQKIERVEARMEDGFARVEREFLETRALIQLSYRQLQERVETLEQRVQIIEKRLGLSA